MFQFTYFDRSDKKVFIQKNIFVINDIVFVNQIHENVEVSINDILNVI